MKLLVMMRFGEVTFSIESVLDLGLDKDEFLQLFRRSSGHPFT